MASTMMAQRRTQSKPPKAFRCTIHDLPGTLVQADQQIWFLTDETTVPFEVEMAPWTCLLGEVGLYETQAIMDRLHGGPAQIACARQMEVA